MNHKITALLIALLLVMVCTGCGKPSRKETVPQEPQTEAYSAPFQTQAQPPEHEQTEASPNPTSYEKLLENSTFNGVVTEVWETGCNLIPVHSEGNVAYSAAPGYETEWIPVSYQDACTVQVANVNAQTGTVTYQEASIQDIEKQQSLLIFGEHDSGNVLQAENVFICRFLY